jgi:hypothetical protein
MILAVAFGALVGIAVVGVIWVIGMTLSRSW